MGLSIKRLRIDHGYAGSTKDLNDMNSAIKEQELVHPSKNEVLADDRVDLSMRSQHSNAMAEPVPSHVSQDGAILMRRGTEKCPLFLVHEMHGVDVYFAELAKHIDARLTIYGLPAMPASMPQMRTVEGMARRLVANIRSVQRHGPYRLVGRAFGGVLAYELAVQLIGQDDAVEFLGLIDSYSPTMLRPLSKQNAREALIDRRNGFDLLHLSPAEVVASLKQMPSLATPSLATPSLATPSLAQIRVLNTLFSSQAGSPDRSGLLDKLRQEQVLPWFLESAPLEDICQNTRRFLEHHEALDNYSPQPIAQHVHLYSAKNMFIDLDDENRNSDATLMGWADLIRPDKINPTLLDGDHDAILSPELGSAMSRHILDSNRGFQSAVLGFRSLFQIRSAQKASAPIICVPGAGDNVTRFVQFANVLAGSWQIYALQPRGIDGLQTPHSTVEAASAAYLDEIQKLQPDGRVHLIGHSFGGLIALEIASRLEQYGRPVASLTLIDSMEPRQHRRAYEEYTFGEVMVRFCELLDLSLGFPLSTEPDVLREQTFEEGAETIHREMVRVGALPRASSSNMLWGPLRTFAAALRTNYLPRRSYPNAVHLVLASDTKLNAEENDQEQVETAERWTQWIPNKRTWVTEADHFSMLKLPEVQELGEWWRDNVAAVAD